jgi:hypothetical protein
MHPAFIASDARVRKDGATDKRHAAGHPMMCVWLVPGTARALVAGKFRPPLLEKPDCVDKRVNGGMVRWQHPSAVDRQAIIE